MLALPTQGNLRVPLSLMVGMAILWSYHSRVLQQDAATPVPTPPQPAEAGFAKVAATSGRTASSIRRLYYYLVAAIGLAAFLVGLGGDLSVIIRALGGGFIQPYREQLAIFSAALIAGLPVWALPWRQVQATATAAGASGSEERRSLVRKIYLYFYLTAATLTVLGTGVYVLYRLLSVLLGADSQGNLAGSVGQNLAFLLIGAAVWLYHAYALRTDARLARLDQAAGLAGYRVLVIDAGDGGFGEAVLERLGRELPGLNATSLRLATDSTSEIAGEVARARIIVAPWVIAAPGVASGPAAGAVRPEVAALINASQATKVLVPVALDGWQWAGIEDGDAGGLARAAARATRQLVEGREVTPGRLLSPGTIAAIAAAVLIGLPVLIFAISMFMSLIRRY